MISTPLRGRFFLLLVGQFPPGVSQDTAFEKSPESFRDFSFELGELGKISDGTVPTSDGLAGPEEDFLLDATPHAFVDVFLHAKLPYSLWPKVFEFGVKDTISESRGRYAAKDSAGVLAPSRAGELGTSQVLHGHGKGTPVVRLLSQTDITRRFTLPPIVGRPIPRAMPCMGQGEARSHRAATGFAGVVGGCCTPDLELSLHGLTGLTHTITWPSEHLSFMACADKEHASGRPTVCAAPELEVGAAQK